MCSHKNSSVSLSGECVAEVREINEVCNGLSKRGTWSLWPRTPPVYGETDWANTLKHTLTHMHITDCQTKKLQVGIKMLSQCQSNRWTGLFYDVCPLFSHFSWRGTRNIWVHVRSRSQRSDGKLMFCIITYDTVFCFFVWITYSFTAAFTFLLFQNLFCIT